MGPVWEVVGWRYGVTGAGGQCARTGGTRGRHGKGNMLDNVIIPIYRASLFSVPEIFITNVGRCIILSIQCMWIRTYAMFMYGITTSTCKPNSYVDQNFRHLRT